MNANLHTLRISDPFRDYARFEALDLIDLCCVADIMPGLIHGMIKGLDRSDEIAIDAAIRVGIHRFNPALDDYAHLFIRQLSPSLQPIIIPGNYLDDAECTVAARYAEKRGITSALKGIAA